MHPPGVESRRWLGFAGLVRAEASRAASAYQGRFFCVSWPAPIILKRFRKKVTRDRILSEAKKKRYFVSKSEQRRMAKRKAQCKERRRRWKQ